MKSFPNIFVMVTMLISLFLNVIPVTAQENPFPLPDVDGDALSNELENAGWYNLSGGPYMTDPHDRDSDNDGLTDGEEKLFDTNPLDPHSPGIASRYEDSYATSQYFRTSDSKYLSIKQGGDQYLMQEAVVVRRGTTFSIAGPDSGTLTLTGTNMTALTPIRDVANGGWRVIIPTNGTVGTYTATVTDGSWSKSMPVYVIFEIPADLPQDEIDAFLYNGDPENVRDEVVPFFRMWDWNYTNEHNSSPLCPYDDPNAPCSNWDYHTTFGYAQAYWTEQFTKAALVDNAIKGIHGSNSQADATYDLSRWFDTEFRTHSGLLQNNFTSAMYRWWDGTGWQSNGGYCETTATTYAAMLRSAGIPANVIQVDYNKTYGHGESGQVGNTYEYDTATIMWYSGGWHAQKGYVNPLNTDPAYYPWNTGVTAITTLADWRKDVAYWFGDKYGDGVFVVNHKWNFQDGSGAGGTVNQIWPIPQDEWAAYNRDYEWDSKEPLQITQSPHVDVLNYLYFKGDTWNPSEWRRPPVSNPPGRDEYKTYILDTTLLDPLAPLENWPTNPKPIACSPATPQAECDAFLASWSPDNMTNGMMTVSIVDEERTNSFYPLLIDNENLRDTNIKLGNIISEYGIDSDGNDYFDELVVKFEVTSSVEKDVQFGGILSVGESVIRGATENITLKPGKQIVEITFDGFQIADSQTDGPYQVTTLWAVGANQPYFEIVEPNTTLAYESFSYNTQAYDYTQFKILAATINSDGINHSGIDQDGNGLYETMLIKIPLNIEIPGSFTMTGDLYDSKGDFVGNATWTGTDPQAKLKFDVEKTSPPYTLEHLYLTITDGELLDSRFAPSYEVDDMDGEIETGNVTFANENNGDPSLMQPMDVDPTGTYTITPVDMNGNGLYDILRIGVGVTVTDTLGNYRIEGLLEDQNGTEIAWAVSGLQNLGNGYQTMTLDFDGQMLYDQLPLTGTRAFKLVAVKIFSGNLSAATLESEAKYAITTPAYARNQFEPSSPAVTLFQDDLENGTSKWLANAWILNSGTWKSWTNSWMTTSTGSLSMTSPLDLSDYAGPVLHYEHAYRLGSLNDKAELQVSTDGGSTWLPIKTDVGANVTPHWLTEDIDLSVYGELADVRLRFKATQSTPNGLLWYMDDVYINAWPAVKTASFTYPTEVIAGVPAAFIASYTSIDTTLPMTYTWNFNGEEVITTEPTANLTFPDIGDVLVTLTVSSPYDSASTSQTITVIPKVILSVEVDPVDGGTVIRDPDQNAFDIGTEVTLTAVPNTGYTFSGWSGGGCSGTEPCIVIMNADTTITATFAINTYTLTYKAGANGSLTGTTVQTVNHGTSGTTVTAVPNAGYHFVNWSDGSTDNPRTDENVTSNITATANFAINTYMLTVYQPTGGSIAPTSAEYDYGEVVNLLASPDLGYYFVEWTGACSGSGTCSVIMDADKMVGAIFEQYSNFIYLPLVIH
jgi:hypothetical protein